MGPKVKGFPPQESLLTEKSKIPGRDLKGPPGKVQKEGLKGKSRRRGKPPKNAETRKS